MHNANMMVVDKPPNQRCLNVERYVFLWRHYSLKETNQDKEINEESWQAARHASNTAMSSKFKGNLAMHMHEETGVQLMCAASYDVWCTY